MLICKNCEDTDIHVLKAEAVVGYDESDYFIEDWAGKAPRYPQYQCRNCGHIWRGKEVENEGFGAV